MQLAEFVIPFTRLINRHGVYLFVIRVRNLFEGGARYKRAAFI